MIRNRFSPKGSTRVGCNKLFIICFEKKNYVMTAINVAMNIYIAEVVQTI